MKLTEKDVIERQVGLEFPLNIGEAGNDEVKEVGSKLVMAVVKKGYAYQVVKVANENGAKGAFILDGRGASTHKKRFFGLDIAPEKEVVLMVVNDSIVYPVIKSIYAIAGFKTTVKGVVFALPISMLLD
ncbi:MAG: hypothetical protein J6J23_03250 [Clostridia bacterium]|nr:hypothetical protein [Clostridia bacterium]